VDRLLGRVVGFGTARVPAAGTAQASAPRPLPNNVIPITNSRTAITVVLFSDSHIFARRNRQPSVGIAALHAPN